MNITDLPKLYTTKQIADHLDVSEATIDRERRAGKLAYTKVRGGIRYTPSHLAAYLEKNECGTTSSPVSVSGTSAGRTAMAPQAAHQLAREIAQKPTKRSRDMSSLTIDPKINV